MQTVNYSEFSPCVCVCVAEMDGWQAAKIFFSPSVDVIDYNTQKSG